MHSALIEGRSFWDNDHGVSRPIRSSKEWRSGRSIQELRKMVKMKGLVAWVALFITVIAHAITMAFWVGNIATQVNNNTKKLDEYGADQKIQMPMIYSMPYLNKSVDEIKGDVKELKQLILERNIKNHKGG